MKNEKWKDIEGFIGKYRISNNGRVESVERQYTSGNGVVRKTGGLTLSPTTDKDGYLHVILYKEGRRKTCKIHRLVALAFLKNTKKRGCVNHVDGNKKNNNYNNLEWCSVKENNNHADTLGLRDVKGEKCYKSKLKREQVLEIRKMIKEGAKHSDVSRIYSVTRSTCSAIHRRETWKHI